MFVTALFINAKGGNNVNVEHNVVHTYNLQLCTRKRNPSVRDVTTWTNSQKIISSEKKSHRRTHTI